MWTQYWDWTGKSQQLESLCACAQHKNGRQKAEMTEWEKDLGMLWRPAVPRCCACDLITVQDLIHIILALMNQYWHINYCNGLYVFRDALIKMKDVYEKNPQMGDPSSLQPKLTETMSNMDRLRMEIHKNEVRF